MKTRVYKPARRSRIFQGAILTTCAIVFALPAQAGSIGKLHFKKAKSEMKTVAFNFETAVDEPMEIEPWMTDDVHFGAFNKMFAVEAEKPLEIEPWMICEKHFVSSLACEKELEIEPWMTDDYYWQLKTRTLVISDSLSDSQSILANCK